MYKFLTLVAASFMVISSAECIQIIHAPSRNRSSEETHRLNQEEEQMEMNRESLRIQRQMLNEYQSQNLRNRMNYGR